MSLNYQEKEKQMKKIIITAFLILISEYSFLFGKIDFPKNPIVKNEIVITMTKSKMSKNDKLAEKVFFYTNGK